ncbi:SDR family NAD(P)-dependent oxidoreductase [Sphingomonas koreensis]|jgi:NAD(P)-dependent dehydrogenase (short-subunit alcohol dehydrogenase family)|uniref:SDR family oxidoreductase n=1 Tax=Sphingomonas koreensis TaxID=93064 RepID=A0A1L6J574_9SPHN|nr:SDR family oxidoreductase [Sphingomonas koreensis]APR51103.1 short-chain dehydrogenase [Sphingomonas koreensis]MDC7810607.1 SDR family oxidoreductase [Sphingomonas koreensis]PJI89515.1 NAD(P)-dependent dehydrogenase (short-subunit alcohol dehydrogenase family) [Sphingomonas koreensis]RSU17707.1 SDR family NAD(P)-dependent oxidoreductase [Sphingomonas koreensis]RSU21953.1 SDR family NAD(P)-dependent oxidoreductase [Sphingomonas koreensis]
MFAEGLLRNSRILVTGGGSGLGKEIARSCVALGATVYLCGRRSSVLEEAAAELGTGAIPIVCDIKSSEAIEAMLDTIWASGPLTGLVNNAAGNFLARTEDLSMRGFDAIADIVFKGTFQMTQACGKRWLAGGTKGSVVSILATWVWNGSPFAVPSAMSKAGVHVMTQSLAVEWGGRGIRLNAICPGPFETEGASARLNPTGDSRFGWNPMGRHGTPQELGNLAIFLLAPGAEFINGQTIAIDGAAWQGTGQNFSALTEWSDAQWADAKAAARGIDARDKAARG